MRDKTKQKLEMKKNLEIAASVEILFDEETPSIDEELLLELGMYSQKESVGGVKSATEDYNFSFAVLAARLTDLTRKGQLNIVERGEAQEKALNIL